MLPGMNDVIDDLFQSNAMLNLCEDEGTIATHL